MTRHTCVCACARTGRHIQWWVEVYVRCTCVQQQQQQFNVLKKKNVYKGKSASHRNKIWRISYTNNDVAVAVAVFFSRSCDSMLLYFFFCCCSIASIFHSISRPIPHTFLLLLLCYLYFLHVVVNFLWSKLLHGVYICVCACVYFRSKANIWKPLPGHHQCRVNYLWPTTPTHKTL